MSEQKSDGRFTLRGKFTSIRVIHICHFDNVKLLGLAEQNHGYLTSLHRIRSDKISDKERRVRKFPTFEMATMLWRHMVIKFDNDPGLVNAMLNIANIYSSARCIKTVVYLQLVFLISSPESGLSFWSSSSSQCYLHQWQRKKGYIKVRFCSTSLGQCFLRDSVVCQRQSFKTCCSVRWSSYKPMFTFAILSTWKSCNFIFFDNIYIFLVRKSFTFLSFFLRKHNCFSSQAFRISKQAYLN